MKPIERVRLGQQISAAMKSQFGFDDVDVFFKKLGIARPEFPGSYYIHDLIRGYLNKCSDETIVDIAIQLGLDQPLDPAERRGASKYWLTDHFRLFVSHVHTVKDSVGALKNVLQKYGISAFVAHEDIKPSAEWREELLKAMSSMDALLAVLTKDFNSSKWTDQEVGAAIYKGVLIIPINKGVLPYGFIEQLQDFKTTDMKVGDVADKIFKTIYESEKTRDRIIHCLSSTIGTAPDVAVAAFKTAKLAEIPNVPISAWESVRENVGANPVLKASEEFIQTFNAVLKAVGVQPLDFGPKRVKKSIDDQIPF